MTEDVESLVLEHLKRSQAELSRMRDEQKSSHASITAVQQTLNAHSTLLHQCVEDIATVRVRLDRIERRLELVDEVV